MSTPVLRYARHPVADLEVDVLVLGVSSGEEGPVLHAQADDLGDLGPQLAAIGVTGKREELVRLPAPAGLAAGSLALVGLGAGAPSPATLRAVAGAVTRSIGGVASIGFALPADGLDDVAALAEGALLGAYRYTASRSHTLAKQQPAAAEITIAGWPAPEDAARPLARAEAVAEAMALVKDLVHTPPQALSPAALADRAAAAAKQAGLAVQLWDEAALAKDGFGGILGVGQGSVRPPRLVRLEHRPAAAAVHLALVGKGITFDSGGLSLKQPASMVGMKYDMTGAATALAVTLAAARLGLPLRITAWLCLAENLPSGSALRPNDVLTIHGGRTVEVLNTDAEGRLVLADGLDAASAEQPDLIVDIATLTGAATVALGTRTAAVMGTGEAVEQLLGAAEAAGEQFWPMPLPDELRALLESEVADLANAKPGNTAAGMLLAAVFLREFVGRREDGAPIPWAHLDIAGTAYNKGGGYGFTAPGPTGVAVRALLGLAEQLGRSPE